MLTDQKSFNVLDKETTIEIKLTSQNICKRRTIRIENFLKEGVDFSLLQPCMQMLATLHNFYQIQSTDCSKI